jgi:HEAT repeat protein
MAFKRLKATIRSLLRVEPFERALEELSAIPERQAINPLFGLLYDGDPLTRWLAVSAMGYVTARLAEHHPEGARVIMRRLMWNLNDESGGIGWGSPEAMGEIMARSEAMAREYAAILVSYLSPEGNFLEHMGLQEGVLWAVGRLGRVSPQRVAEALPFLGAFLESPEPTLRALALWALLPLRSMGDAGVRVDRLVGDPAPVTIYEAERFVAYTVGNLVRMLSTG